MLEELQEEQRRLRATYFRLEREMREVKQQLEAVNKKLSGVEEAGPVQMSLPIDEPEVHLSDLPPDEEEDAFAALAREPVPEDVEVIYNPSTGQSPADFTFKGTGHRFYETIVTTLGQRDNATSALLIDALRLQFPDRTVSQLRSQLNITLKRMMDQRRIHKVSRGVYALISPEKTVSLTRSGHPA